MPDLLLPFAIAFCLEMIVAMILAKFFVNENITRSEMLYNRLSITDGIVIVVILVGVCMAYFSGKMRPDHLLSIGITAVAAYVISGLMVYAASNLISGENLSPIQVGMYVIGLFLVFCFCSFVITVVMNKLSRNTGQEPPIGSMLKDTVDQQKKLGTYGILVISVIVAIFFALNASSENRSDSFSPYLAYVVAAVGCILIPLIAFIGSYFQHDANSLFYMLSGIISGLIVLYFSRKITWTKEMTGVLFIFMSFLLLIANSSSQFPRTLSAILLSSFAIAAAQVASDGDRLVFIALASITALFFAEFNIFDGYGNQTIMFLTFIAIYSVSSDVFFPNTTWDTFGLLFCTFLATGLMLAALRVVLFFMSSKFVQIYGSVFDATSINLSYNLSIVLYVIIITPFIKFIVDSFDKGLKIVSN